MARTANPETRDSLMEAAFGLVRRMGLAATRVDEICAAAGVSKGGVLPSLQVEGRTGGGGDADGLINDRAAAAKQAGRQIPGAAGRDIVDHQPLLLTRDLVEARQFSILVELHHFGADMRNDRFDEIEEVRHLEFLRTGLVEGSASRPPNSCRIDTGSRTDSSGSAPISLPISSQGQAATLVQTSPGAGSQASITLSAMAGPRASSACSRNSVKRCPACAGPPAALEAGGQSL